MGKRIMCVDDSPTIRQLVRKALEPDGYTIVDAADGADALAKVDGSEELFLVDVNMPVMDGFVLVENLKGRVELARKPVVFLTTESSEQKKGKGKALGVNGWIVKPFEPGGLSKIVRMLVG